MASHARVVRHKLTAGPRPSPQLQQLLRPLVKAFALGYASSTTPRLLTLLVSLITRKPRPGEEGKIQYAVHRIVQILRGGLDPQRFPTFCAALIGGSTLLHVSIFM